MLLCYSSSRVRTNNNAIYVVIGFSYVEDNYVDPDYVETIRFKILDMLGVLVPELDGNGNPTGIVNNNIINF